MVQRGDAVRDEGGADQGWADRQRGEGWRVPEEGGGGRAGRARGEGRTRGEGRRVAGREEVAMVERDGGGTSGIAQRIRERFDSVDVQALDRFRGERR